MGGHWLAIFWEEDIDLCFKSKAANDLIQKFMNLIDIFWKKLLFNQKLEK